MRPRKNIKRLTAVCTVFLTLLLNAGLGFAESDMSGSPAALGADGVQADAGCDDVVSAGSEKETEEESVVLAEASGDILMTVMRDEEAFSYAGARENGAVMSFEAGTGNGVAAGGAVPEGRTAAVDFVLDYSGQVPWTLYSRTGISSAVDMTAEDLYFKCDVWTDELGDGANHVNSRNFALGTYAGWGYVPFADYILSLIRI